jgi:hypothetical protein
MSTREGPPRVVERDRELSGSPVARVLSLLLLAVAGAVLIYAVWLAGTYTFTHAGPPCTNPPQRESNPAQLVVVAICLVTFAAGHLTTRWQEINHRLLQRHRTPKDSTSRKAPDEDKRKKDALIIQALLLVFLLEIIGLLVIEMTTLSNGVWPITYYVRCAYDAAGWPSTAAAAAIMFLVGRWFWLPPRGKNARPGS